MERLLKKCAVVGMVWSVLFGLFMLILIITHGVGGGTRLFLCVLLLHLWWRCYLLYRGAAALCCVYCWWMVWASLESGIWQWTGGWVVASLFFSAVVALAWDRLKPGV